MTIAITDEHLELAAAVRRFLDKRCPPEIARASMDSPHGPRPDFWDAFAQNGWLGLHVSDQHGGSGYGLLETAVVLEELGRSGAPEPFLTTILTSAILSRSGVAGLKTRLLPALAAGTSIGALAFPGTSRLKATRTAITGELSITGTLGPVPGGGMADWLLAPVQIDEIPAWYVLDTPALVVRDVESLDPTLACSVLEAVEVVLPPGSKTGITTAEVEMVIAALVSAYCAGGAGWCLDEAVAHARSRHQFGRPIGQFQAIKHKCANMLVAVEQARATAADAAMALGTPGSAAVGAPAPEAQLAAAIAGAIAPEAFVHTAKECIQVLGGIGFTWEHDAHRYLRRSVSLRQLLGGSVPRRARIAVAALEGTRRQNFLELPASADECRIEVASFLDSIAKLERRQQRVRLVDSGYFVPHWPEPWGRSADAVAQLVIDQELSRRGIRRANLGVGAWAAPTIAVHGSVEQGLRWVGPTLRGEINWCQLFSEPGAGSDLAALTTKAKRTDRGWNLSGQKVWTSLAAEADWGICLARTDTNVDDRHLGITYFVVDMRSPGIEIRPLRELTGMSLFNEVFLTDVYVPDDCVIGSVNGGWALARTTLANERVAMGSGTSFGGGVESLLALVNQRRTEQPEAQLEPKGDGSQSRVGTKPEAWAAWPDQVALDQIGALVAEAQSVALLGLRSTQRAVAGATGAARPGPEASIRKLLGAEHDQRTQELGLSLLGVEGIITEGAGGQWTFGFLANRCLTIAGGTSEIQRNVIAERLLGLPRDPEPES